MTTTHSQHIDIIHRLRSCVAFIRNYLKTSAFRQEHQYMFAFLVANKEQSGTVATRESDHQYRNNVYISKSRGMRGSSG